LAHLAVKRHAERLTSAVSAISQHATPIAKEMHGHCERHFASITRAVSAASKHVTPIAKEMQGHCQRHFASISVATRRQAVKNAKKLKMHFFPVWKDAMHKADVYLSMRERRQKCAQFMKVAVERGLAQYKHVVTSQRVRRTLRACFNVFKRKKQ